jgi:hypothetical protein
LSATQPAINEGGPAVTDSSGNAIPFPRFQNYLAGIAHPVPEEQVLAKMAQSFYRWIFDLLRSGVIAGGLQYFGDTTGSLTLKILWIAAYVALAGYCLSYITWMFTPFHFVRDKRLGWYLNVLATLVVVVPIWGIVLLGLPYTINEIAHSQAATHSSSTTSPAATTR